METFYTAFLNVKKGEFAPMTENGLFSSPEKAIAHLRKFSPVEESPGRLLHSRLFADSVYLVLPVTDYVRDNYFNEDDYLVIYRKEYGEIGITRVKSRVNLADIEYDSEIVTVLMKQIGAIEILDIQRDGDVQINEIEFDAVQ